MFAIALTLLLAAEPPSTPETAAPPRLGAAVAPAALPAGTIAFSGFIGAPEIGAAYRQGFSFFELEARARFHYLELSAVAEVGARFATFQTARTVIAPTFSLGLKFNSGARVFDQFNVGYVALRPRLGLVTSISVSELLQVLVVLDVPWSIALNVTAFQIAPTAGAGVEFQVNPKLSLYGLARGGVDVIKEPLGVPVARFAWGLELGVGYRLF